MQNTELYRKTELLFSWSFLFGIVIHLVSVLFGSCTKLSRHNQITGRNDFNQKKKTMPLMRSSILGIYLTWISLCFYVPIAR